MSFTTTLLQWFKENGRDLPWRQTRDPYAVWLSEIILQQTRTEQGRPYWERFMRRWPTVEQLAAATEDEVLRAFDLPAAVVDGNVYRVLARHYGIKTPINTTEGKKEFTALAQSLLPPDAASAYNQAIMDFGAIHCTPVNPYCDSCPLMDTCAAFRTGAIDTLPVKLKKLEVKERHLTYIYIRCKGQTALHRRPPGDIWQGLYEPLCLEESKVLSPEARLLKKNVRHVLTHRVLLADFWLWETDERPQLPEGYFWVDEGDIDSYAVPRLVEKLLDELSPCRQP